MLYIAQQFFHFQLLMDKVTLLKQLMALVEEDASKFFERENNAAGTRLRNHLQQIKTLAQELRNEVQEEKSKRKG